MNQPESSKSVFQKSSGRMAGLPHQLIFHVPLRDLRKGVAGSKSFVSAADTVASGMEYALAGSRLRELTAGFSQSLVAAEANAAAAAIAVNAVIFMLTLLLAFIVS